MRVRYIGNREGCKLSFLRDLRENGDIFEVNRVMSGSVYVKTTKNGSGEWHLDIHEYTVIEEYDFSIPQEVFKL